MGKQHIEFIIRIDRGTYGSVFIYDKDECKEEFKYGDHPEASADHEAVSLNQIIAVRVPGSNLESKIDDLINTINIGYVPEVPETISVRLTNRFVYPEVVKQITTSGNDFTAYHEVHEGRPTLEVLFFERQDLFVKLVMTLIKRNNDSFYQAFFDALAKTKLAKYGIFQFDNTITDKIKKIIVKLNSHAQTMKRANAQAKAAAITILTQKLMSQLADYDSYSTNNEGLEKQFKQLHAKLQLITTLWQTDDVLSMRLDSYGYNPKNTKSNHWGYYSSRALNAVSVLLIGLPFLINKFIRGNWFFFSDTTTEKYLTQARKTLISSKEEIKFAAVPKEVAPILSPIPLQVLSEVPNAEWTADNETHYNLILTKLSNALPEQYQPDETDKTTLQALVKAYVATGKVEFYQKVAGIYNLILEYLDQSTAGNVNKTNKEMYKQYQLPLLKYFHELTLEYPNQKKLAAMERRVRFVLKIKFGLDARELSGLFASISDSYVYDAPKGVSYKDNKKEPYKSLAILAHPKFIDAVLMKRYPQAYEQAKQDQDFQKLMQELVNIHRQYVFENALRNIYFLYLGSFKSFSALPHLFHKHKNRALLYSNIPTQSLPHPFLYKAAKAKFKDSLSKQHEDDSVIAQLVGSELIAQKYPEFKDWLMLPKNGGKDPGFILESPDGKERLYVKCTGNMIIEFLAAKMLNHLGIKMAEASLFATAEGNYFFVTRGLSRQYQKPNGAKHKLFQPFCEAAPEPVGYNRELHPEVYGSKEEQQARQREFVTRLFADSAGLTKLSFAKLLLAGLTLSLSDFGGHGGNIGPITTEKSGKRTQKLAVVDYQINTNPVPMSAVTSLEQLQGWVSYYSDSMAPLFKDLVKQLSLSDLQKALQLLQTPKCYTRNSQGYFVTQGETRQTYNAAVELAYTETITELESVGVLLTPAIQEQLLAYKDLALSRLSMMMECLVANAVTAVPAAQVELRSRLG
jgi:hypothetical protein